MLRTTVAAVVFTTAFSSFPVQASSNHDPLEPVNRVIFKFNQHMDDWILKPVARTYKFIVPEPLRMMIGNFYNNLDDFSSIYNSLLQGNVKDSSQNLARFVVNSTLGGFGLVDVASGFEIPRHKEDLGLTFAAWGWKHSTYLVIPLLGPTTLRDGVGRVADYSVNPESWPSKESTRIDLLALNLVQLRATYLDKEKTFNAAAVDRYSAMRNVYLQHRDFLINGSSDAEDEPNELATW